MSKIQLSAPVTGTATFTVASPATNTDRTITLPDATTTLVGTADFASQAEAQAGTSNTKLMTPLRVSEAITSLSPSPIGVGQTWQNMTSSRSPGVAYTNTTGRPIMVNITFNPTGSTASVSVAGIQVGATTTVAGYSNYQTISFIVPAGNSYQSSNIAGSIVYWAELR